MTLKAGCQPQTPPPGARTEPPVSCAPALLRAPACCCSRARAHERNHATSAINEQYCVWERLTISRSQYYLLEISLSYSFPLLPLSFPPPFFLFYSDTVKKRRLRW